MKSILLPFIFFLFGVGLAVTWYVWQHQPAHKPALLTTATPTPVPRSVFSIEKAPTGSIQGTITSMSGTIEWQSRIATEPAQMSISIPIQQGETLIASDGGRISVDFAPAGAISLLPQSTVDIIQTLPPHLVFEQKKGSITYAVTTPHDLAVRSWHLLTQLTTGSMDVNMDEETQMVSVQIKTGTATVAYNNADFISQVISLQAGDTFLFDEEEREGVVE